MAGFSQEESLKNQFSMQLSIDTSRSLHEFHSYEYETQAEYKEVFSKTINEILEYENFQDLDIEFKIEEMDIDPNSLDSVGIAKIQYTIHNRKNDVYRTFNKTLPIRVWYDEKRSRMLATFYVPAESDFY